MKKLLTILTAICLMAAAGCAAEGAALEEMALELGRSSVRFPAVTGMADAGAETRVNEQIRQDLHVDDYLTRMTALISDEVRSITVTWDGGILGDVFSCAAQAEGSVNPPRNSHVWTAANVDLRDGHEITFDELFIDGDAAREAIETLLEETVAGEQNPHQEGSALTPLPETFRLERTGLTLLYGIGQLSTLTGRAGAVKIGWNDIWGYVDPSEDGIIERIGARDTVALTEASPARIRETAESGQLPDIPVKIGDSVKEWTDRAHLLNDPEEYGGGRMFELEGAAFRGVYILSDKVSSGWDGSTVQGIRMDRGSLWGLCIGETTADEWHMLLGEPEDTAVFDEARAEEYRTESGACDYYQYGDYRLQLQYRENGTLIGITLAR